MPMGFVAWDCGWVNHSDWCEVPMSLCISHGADAWDSAFVFVYCLCAGLSMQLSARSACGWVMILSGVQVL